MIAVAKLCQTPSRLTFHLRFCADDVRTYTHTSSEWERVQRYKLPADFEAIVGQITYKVNSTGTETSSHPYAKKGNIKSVVLSPEQMWIYERSFLHQVAGSGVEVASCSIAICAIESRLGRS